MNYLLTFELLFLPVLICRIRTHRRSLVTGLFLALIFLGQLHPLLPLVPLSAAVHIFISGRRHEEPAPGELYIKKPGASALTVFICTMALFCAFSTACKDYGILLDLNSPVMQCSEILSYAACAAGPILAGNRCDRRGPFSTAMLLTLCSELSVLLISAGSISPILFILGSILISLCVSGFFVLLPSLITVFHGEKHFIHFYLSAASSFFAFWSLVRFQYRIRPSGPFLPEEVLVILLVLSVLSALFLFTAWKKRLVLVQIPNTAQKTGS